MVKIFYTAFQATKLWMHTKSNVEGAKIKLLSDRTETFLSNWATSYEFNVIIMNTGKRTKFWVLHSALIYTRTNLPVTNYVNAFADGVIASRVEILRGHTRRIEILA